MASVESIQTIVMLYFQIDLCEEVILKEVAWIFFKM